MKTQTETLRDRFIARNPSENQKIWDEVSEEMDFALKLKKERLKAHMKQSDLSTKSGISQSDISKIENGVISPTVKTLKKYLNALGKDLTFMNIK